MPDQFTMTPELIERFWSKADKSGECWVWTRAKTSSGYGETTVPGKRVAYAHRVAYELTHGPIPPRMFVCHTCDNPSCVRPEHLFLGTHQDNMDDMQAKRRGYHPPTGPKLLPEQYPRGERHGCAKLNDEQVREIRRLYAAGGETTYTLAARFGVNQRTAWGIVAGKTWRHLT